jgi:hypothetical protein
MDPELLQSEKNIYGVPMHHFGSVTCLFYLRCASHFGFCDLFILFTVCKSFWFLWLVYSIYGVQSLWFLWYVCSIYSVQVTLVSMTCLFYLQCASHYGFYDLFILFTVCKSLWFLWLVYSIYEVPVTLVSVTFLFYGRRVQYQPTASRT